MTYVIADIHGCYDEFRELLDKIGFSDDDELYILGDAVDRGREPIKLLLDIMERPNVQLILGNHEFMMLSALRRLNVEITDESIKELKSDDLTNYINWITDGGAVTSRQFTALPPDQRQAVLEYITDEALVYEELFVGGNRFVLSHAGLNGFSEEKGFDALFLADFCMFRADYDKRYFADENTFLITGHTPTMAIRGDKEPLIFERNGHIAIDCGCVFGGRLAAYCLETGGVFYVDMIRREEHAD